MAATTHSVSSSTEFMAGYRPAVLNAPINNHEDLNPEILAVKTLNRFAQSTFQGTFGSTIRWEQSSVLGWNFLVSLNRCTAEVNIFELGTTLPGNCSRYSICAWITLQPPRRTSVNSTLVKFGILNDLITNTRLLIQCTVCRAATNN
jgi:hypothetical protein